MVKGHLTFCISLSKGQVVETPGNTNYLFSQQVIFVSFLDRTPKSRLVPVLVCIVGSVLRGIDKIFINSQFLTARADQIVPALLETKDKIWQKFSYCVTPHCSSSKVSFSCFSIFIYLKKNTQDFSQYVHMVRMDWGFC